MAVSGCQRGRQTAILASENLYGQVDGHFLLKIPIATVLASVRNLSSLAPGISRFPSCPKVSAMKPGLRESKADVFEI